VFGWFSDRHADDGYTMARPDRALQVLDQMVQMGLGTRPLFLICHSLGGLLAKQILRKADESDDERKKLVATQTRAILFLSTPHAGAALATLVHSFRAIFGATVSIEELRAHDPQLRDLFDWYRRRSAGLGIKTTTYYEQRSVRGILPIVNPTSAHPGVGDDPVGVGEDHLSIAKPRDRNAQIYLAARDLLRDYVLGHQVRRGPADLSPWDFTAYLDHKRRGFTGREWLFEQINSWMASGNERALLITGDPGIGKSAIAAQLVHLNAEGQVIAHHCCQADTRATLEPWRFVRSLAAMIATRVPSYDSRLADACIRDCLSEANCRRDAGSAFEEGILGPLHVLPVPSGRPRYLLIDALDEGLTFTGGMNIVDLLATRIDRLPSWLKLVATTRKEPEVISRLAGLRARQLDAHDPRNLEDVERYIVSRLTTSPLDDFVVRSAHPAQRMIQSLCDKSDGNFLYAQQALDGLERGLYRLDELDRLPPGLFGLYRVFFERRYPDEPTFMPARTLLDVVAAAAEPLTKDQLLRASGLDAETAFPSAWQSLSAYLTPEPKPTDQATYSFFHKSLEDWLTHPDRRAQLHSASPNRGHRRLADWAWSQYILGVEHLSAYARRYLPGHLIGIERWDDLEAVLSDLTYLEARTRAAEIFALMTDYLQAVAALPPHRSSVRRLQLLCEALNRDIHFIDRHRDNYPQALFQCLWNICWWYDCPEANNHYQEKRAPGSADGVALHRLMESWRNRKEQESPRFLWIRSLRPPALPLTSPLKFILREHLAPINHVRYSFDGSRIASASADGTVRIWNAKSGQHLLCLEGHTCAVNCADFSKDGSRVVTASGDASVRIWNAHTGEELCCLTGHDKAVHFVRYSPDGTRIASASYDDTVRVWNLLTREVANCICVRWPMSVEYSPDGLMVVVGSLDNTIQVLDAASGEQLGYYTSAGVSNLFNVVFVDHGRRFVSSSQYASLDIDGKERHPQRRGGTIVMQACDNGDEIVCITGLEYYVATIACSPDGLRIAGGCQDGSVRVWDSRDGRELAVFQGHSAYVKSISYSPVSADIVSGASDHTVRVWGASGRTSAFTSPDHRAGIFTLCASPDGSQFASAASLDETLRVWSIANGRLVFSVAVEEVVHGSFRSGVVDIAYSPDGACIASSWQDGKVRVWDAKDGRLILCVDGHGCFAAVAYTQDGARIITHEREDDKEHIHMWDAKTGACLDAEALEGMEIAQKKISWTDGRGQDLETVIEAEGNERPVAYYVAPVRNHIEIARRTWAATDDMSVCLFTLEGTLSSKVFLGGTAKQE
jgi:WD40 repeat protein